MKCRSLLIVFLLASSPAFAQSPMQTLSGLRATVGTPMSKEENGRILNATAVRHGLFLLSKPSGNNCPLPGTGEPISCDFLVRPDGGGFDVFSDQEGAGTVVGPSGEPKEFFASERMIRPSGTPSQLPAQPPVVVTSAVDLSAVKAWTESVRDVLYEQAERVRADDVRARAEEAARDAALAAKMQQVLDKPSGLEAIVKSRTFWEIVAGLTGAFTTMQVAK